MAIVLSLIALSLILWGLYSLHKVARYQSMTMWQAFCFWLSLYGTVFGPSQGKRDLGFYRSYRVQDYNGPGKDLIISHTKLIEHPILSRLELQFLRLPFDQQQVVELHEDFSSTIFQEFSTVQSWSVILISTSVDTEAEVEMRIRELSK